MPGPLFSIDTRYRDTAIPNQVKFCTTPPVRSSPWLFDHLRLENHTEYQDPTGTFIDGWICVGRENQTWYLQPREPLRESEESYLVPRSC